MPRPVSIDFELPGGAPSAPFQEALVWFLEAMDMTYDACAVHLTGDGSLGKINRNTVWRWARPAGDKWRQVPEPLKQRHIVHVLKKLYTRQQRTRKETPDGRSKHRESDPG